MAGPRQVAPGKRREPGPEGLVPGRGLMVRAGTPTWVAPPFPPAASVVAVPPPPPPAAPVSFPLAGPVPPLVPAPVGPVAAFEAVPDEAPAPPAPPAVARCSSVTRAPHAATRTRSTRHAMVRFI